MATRINSNSASDSLLTEFKELGLFSNSPGLTNLGTHKILVKPDIKPFKSTPYRMHPDKIKILRKEIDTLLELDIIRPSHPVMHFHAC